MATGSMFTIVVPLYNKAGTIGRTLESVLGQRCQDFDIVVVDDGSDDGGAMVASSLGDPRIRVLRQENGGVSAARNKGIETATGDFVAFLDADDEYDGEHLSTLKRLMETYPGHTVYATSYVTRENGKDRKPLIGGLRFKASRASGEGVMESFFRVASSKHCPVHIGSIAVRRRALGEVRFPVGVKAGEDLYTIALLMTRHDMVFSLAPTYIYNFEDTSRKMGVHEKVDDCFDSLLGSGCMDRYLPRYVALWHTRRAVYALRTGDFRTIRHHLWLSLRIRPLQTKILTAMLSALIKR